MATLEPISKALPGDDGRYQRQRIGALHRKSPIIFIYESVLEEILEFSEQDLRRELGGFLAGGLFEDGEQHAFIEIQHFLPAVDAKSQAAKLTFTHDCLANRDRQMAQRFPDKVLLGWHHTHPGYGIFLSESDLFVHRNFFAHPHQIALVVDPYREELGFWQWQQGQIADCGFVCLRPVK